MLCSSTFLRPATIKFWNVYEQMEGIHGTWGLLWRLWRIAYFCQHTDTRHYCHHLIEGIRRIALWHGPIPQLGCRKRLLYKFMLHVPTEWREQVKELVTALKPLTAAHASLMSLDMEELVYRPISRRLRTPPALVTEKDKEERCEDNESTDSDSDSYSTY
jgi:hypothetical protein